MLWHGQTQGRRRIDTRVIDTALAVLLAVACYASATQFSAPGWPPFDALALLLIGLGNLPLVWRSRAPVVVLVVTWFIWSVYLLLGYPPMATWASLVALYTVAARRPVKVSALCLAAVALLVLVGGLLLVTAVAALGQVLAVVVMWAFGVDRYQLSVLSAQLRYEQEDRAQRAVTEERVRIARELHDIVAHHMSVVSVQAGLARYVFTSDPAVARTALDTIATSSFEAQEEMRRLLIVLRTNGEDPAYAPAPGLADLNELAERVRAAGVPVEVSVKGVPRPVGPGADQCVYRVVQESLTNVIKHAGPAKVVIVLTYTAARLVVRVIDDGVGPSARKRENTAAHGLLGMRERARLYGGAVITGPRPQGGFEVVLTLPLPSAGAQAGSEERVEGAEPE
ncbi:sensor histidine kinase [Nonomuraea sp. NPDC049419]|uniref:sensor histidine kinase n=1 Tax=Nonomuraea sp. NPDC049419 TaxID=3155772 RepID=UPI00343D34EE